MLVVGGGTATIYVTGGWNSSGGRTALVDLYVQHYDPANPTVPITDSSQIGISTMTDTVLTATVPGISSGVCDHWIDVKWRGANGGAGVGYAGFTWLAGSDYTTTGGSIPTVSNTITTTAPTATTDSAHGYATGSTWLNTTTGIAYILVDDTTGAAVWVVTTSGTTLTVQEIDGSPTVAATEIDVPNGSLTVAGTIATLHYVQSINGGAETYQTIAALGATHTLDLANGNAFDATLTANCTLTFSGATAGTLCSFMLLLRQNGTGGWTTTWPGSVIWAGGSAPTVSTTASTLSEFVFETTDGGTVWLGHAVGASGATGAASGDLSGAYPGPTVAKINGVAVTGTPSVGMVPTATSSSAATWQAPTSGVGELVISDTPSTPLVFADILQNDAQTDLLYAG